MPTYFEYLSDEQLAEQIENPEWDLLKRFFVDAGGPKHVSVESIHIKLVRESSRRFVRIIQSR